MQIPFEFALPPDAPPSFAFSTVLNVAHVRYVLEVTGVRSGPFALDQVVRVPLVVIPPDPLGAAVRSPLKLGWQDGWGRLRAEREMRRYPWGAYSRVKAEVCIAHLC